MRMRGWMKGSETLLDLWLAGRYGDWVTIPCTGCSSTGSSRLEENMTGLAQETALKHKRNMENSWKHHRWHRHGSWALVHHLQYSLNARNQTSLPPLLMKQLAIPPAKHPCYSLDYYVEEENCPYSFLYMKTNSRGKSNCIWMPTRIKNPY